jgi:centrin-1
MLSQTHKAEIKKAFDFFDVSGSGVIDSRNLKVVLRALGFESNIEETNKILLEIEDDVKTDNDSKIDFQTFLNVILFKMSEKETEENIQKAFELFVDKEVSGQLNKNGDEK